MLTDNLIAAMGLLKLQSKHKLTTGSEKPVEPKLSHETIEPEAKIQNPVELTKPQAAVKMDKNEFRLLVKMLHAINHECQFEQIDFDGQTVSYQHPKKTLVFADINIPDSNEVMNLSSLADILVDSALKRPVWEKLKTL